MKLDHTMAARCARDLPGIVGQSARLGAVLREVMQVAPTDCTVLVYGETGTGKELIAQAIHHASARASAPFVRLNCAAVPTTLFESELFGHERGAFTGALSRRAGRFEQAERGTLFLDEFGELPLELQPKLLRVLQEREFERVGGDRTLSSDVRLVAATNRDLASMVEAREFREDLYYRLSVFPIRVPPLRERREDIPLLAEHFMHLHAARVGRALHAIDPGTMAALVAHDWPGNIRELSNVIERAVILASGSTLAFSLASTVAAAPRAPLPAAPPEALAEVSRAHILSVLRSTNWVVAGPNGAAARLGLKRSTLHFRMKKLGIVREHAPVPYQLSPR